VYLLAIKILQNSGKFEIYLQSGKNSKKVTKCDLLSQNPISLHIPVLAIEIHGAKYVYHKNNFMHVLITLINSKTELQLY